MPLGPPGEGREATLTSRTSTPHNADLPSNRKGGNVLFNDAINTFYLRLYGVRHTVLSLILINIILDHFYNEWVCQYPQTS